MIPVVKLTEAICSSALYNLHICHLYFQKPPLLTKTDGNFVRLACFFAYQYFPTYNGVDPFEEIECTENGWSLPDDMEPIQCQHAFCPQLLDDGDEVEAVCDRRDRVCTSKDPDIDIFDYDVNDEKYQHCECNSAFYKCKKERQRASYYGTFLVHLNVRFSTTLVAHKWDQNTMT